MSARPPRPALPTTSPLPSTLRLPPASPLPRALLARLSRPALLALVAAWLADDAPPPACAPLLAHDLDPHAPADPDPDAAAAAYPPARTVPALRALYRDLEHTHASKRDVAARVLEGDWRRGLSLAQCAAADLKALEERPERLKWTALRLERAPRPPDESTAGAPSSKRKAAEPEPTRGRAPPRFHGPSFVRALQAELGALVRAHYHLARAPGGLPATLLRLWIRDTPYGGRRGHGHTTRGDDMGRTVYAAFPDGVGFVYVATTGGGAGTLRTIYEAIPRAMAGGKAGWVLTPTALVARSLRTLVEARGPGRGGGAAGAWSVYADRVAEGTPTGGSGHDEDKENRPVESAGKGGEGVPREEHGERDEQDARERKRRKMVAHSRFGTSGDPDDGRGIERFQIRIEEPFALGHSAPPPVQPARRSRTERRAPQRRGRSKEASVVVLAEEQRAGVAKGTISKSWAPSVEVTFHGAHVFAGIRSLVESGAVDGERMPAWMTGEDGVSVGAVKGREVMGHKGTGIWKT